MRSSKNNVTKTTAPAAPVYREIPAQVAQPTEVPGRVGQEAVAAAALHQLNRYADEIEQYVNASNMRLLLNRIQGDLKKDTPAGQPRMRLRRD
jgi:hypothetical protein